MKRGALVLCGGRSRRMGRDKAWLPFGDETMLQRIVRLLEGTVEEIVVVARPGQALPLLDDEIRVVRDDVPDLGPLSGIAGGLAATSADVVYATACDVPFLQPSVLAYLFERLGDDDVAVIEQDGFLHPLAAVYRRSVLDVARRLLAEGCLRPRDLYDQVPTTHVPAEALRDVDPDLETLANLNTEDAWRDAIARLEGAEATRHVTIELYEIARQLAGVTEVEVEATSLGEALRALAAQHPALEGTVVDGDRPAGHWRASVGGRTFVDDPATLVGPGDRIVIVSALAGG